ncbi:hypothetical protein FHX42_005194 [Saccharopolyspora lacisalsi]|uniref:DUF4913 domain-containing protein n=1 Tax=Halosaccharopolyspora lacisalsi TaxID=1000566 RepID=A0A839E7W0_9PSEU|nr:DUF4913 domain-containing protein [Halosaccharopolyspora lacisalsi]MBA8827787.1 hypothetical protein [Halosaccharopolyspora lacisalsi]
MSFDFFPTAADTAPAEEAVPGGEPVPDEQPPAAETGDESAVDMDELLGWVHGLVIPLYQRSLKYATWCPAWFEHPEAVFRLELVRRAWEEAVVADEGSAMSTWMLHHLDPHMSVLTSPTGPFGECEYSQRHGFKHTGHGSRVELPVLDPDTHHADTESE